MQAAFYERQGPADQVFQVGEQPTPLPCPGEVRVRLRTSGVNPSDWKTRKGGGNRRLVAPLIIPHSDGAGEIDSVGEGVSAGRIGERVWIWNGQWKRAHGTAAQYIALPEAQAVKMPEALSYEEGACLGIPALTAMQAVRLANVVPGMTVLVAGGAGSVGHYAIQMAKARGATVLSTVSSAAKAQHALSAGADAAIDYRAGDVSEHVKALTGGGGVDAVIEVDVAANVSLYPDMLRAHGNVVIYGTSASEVALPSLWLMQNSIGLKFFMIYDIPAVDRQGGLAELGALLDAKRLSHTIALRMPLAEVAKAHDIVELGRHIGNVTLLI